MSDDATTEEVDTEKVDTETAEAEEVVEVDEGREELLARFTDALGEAVVAHHIEPGNDLWIRVATDAWRTVAEVARNRLGARYFSFLSVIDWMPSPFGRSMDAAVDLSLAGESQTAEPGVIEHGVTGGDTRFQVFARVAHIGTPNATWALTFKADVPDDSLEVESWTSVFAGADWHEREAWEMFGVSFAGHPGLRNLYLPTGFEGNPLRKDFPILSRHVKPWPGIVDVEGMPTDEDDDAASDGEGGDS